jgi:hypothetical protein
MPKTGGGMFYWIFKRNPGKSVKEGEKVATGKADFPELQEAGGSFRWIFGAERPEIPSFPDSGNEKPGFPLFRNPAGFWKF